MALDKDRLGTKWAQDILSMSGQAPDGPAFAKMKDFWSKIADDLIQEFKQNAEVPSGIPVNAGGYSGSTNGPGKVI